MAKSLANRGVKHGDKEAGLRAHYPTNVAQGQPVTAEDKMYRRRHKKWTRQTRMLGANASRRQNRMFLGGGGPRKPRSRPTHKALAKKVGLLKSTPRGVVLDAAKEAGYVSMSISEARRRAVVNEFLSNL